MTILRSFYANVIRYDLINKFCYTQIKKIPELKKIVLNFGCKSNEIKLVAPALLALKLITFKQGSFTKLRRANMLLKIRKGSIVGCVVILTKETMYDFFLTLLMDIFPNLKDFKGFNVIKQSSGTRFSFSLKELIYFKELEKQFYLFSKLPSLDITFIINSKNKRELIYLLSSFKFPLKND